MRLIGTAVVAAISLVLARPSTAAADAALSLYQAMEIVTGTDLRERPRGFAQCLADVLIKVSGDPRLRSDPRAAAAERHARDYVLSFDYVDPIAGTRPKDDQGTYDRSENLTVTFDPAKIDALLVSLGDRPWRGPRPVLVPLLSVHGRQPPPYLLSADDAQGAEQRGAFERIAGEAGIALHIPPEAEFRKRGIGDTVVAPKPPCGPAATLVVLGTLDWNDAAPGWVGTWRTCWRGARHTWTVRGVSYDQAFESIVEGAARLASGHGTPEAVKARRR